jgi:alanine racemase
MDQTTRPTGVPAHLAGCRLTVDLDALKRNYGRLRQEAGGARVAGVVKADAYGLGIAAVGPALWEAGCRDFFVAMPAEGLAARKVLPEARIFVLAGLFGSEAAAAYAEARLIPILNSQTDIAIWEAAGWEDGDLRKPCALHVDTGMNRLGLTLAEAVSFAEDNLLTGALTPVLLMSHLACADAPEHPLNRRQLESFQAVRARFSGIESSLANSAGTFLGRDFGFDLVRPGIALYGGAPVSGRPNPMEPVATAHARIVQVRQGRSGDSIGYGATRMLDRETAIAIVATGYADGYLRAGSGSGVPLRTAVTAGAHGFINGVRVPLLGRVTMDLTSFDVTEAGPEVAIGDFIELFGPNISVDEAATAAGTISYEMLTSLGGRYHREYVGGTS